ncbi:TetR/AcrR family transcriptional regulator [Tomitella gaofuii]|uniref:TetR/AcrR family transcriptional regulator n=1 Tax=Tomitella gaofuii TaxID=2760083 RepID=UPI0015FD8586
MDTSPEAAGARRPRTAADASAVSAAATEELVPRRRPIQERSKRRFETLLSASRALLVDVGFESFTCEAAAARAGVPIGTLYQFFANKYVIVCELDRQDLVAVQAELTSFGEEVPSLDWPRLLEKFIDHLAGLWLTDPSRRAVWLAVQATPATRATAAIHERALAHQVTEVLAPLTPHARADRRTLIAEVLVHAVYSMLNFSVQDSQDHGDAVRELKRMMTAYLISTERASGPG